ncbi:hypothetical protein BD410DRAFT_790339 [Rickenella mellea]|uniref:Uncharacterized protein n=1 Tax=Rickenella mellea TaxID=50990 RepID=A0A4Y7PZZ8_9AGAM|nr:hypothetical protein BD410DRAFT_790339 [Rickenella mellea]
MSARPPPKLLGDRGARAIIRNFMASCPLEGRTDRLRTLAERYEVKVGIVSRIVKNRYGPPDDLSLDQYYIEKGIQADLRAQAEEDEQNVLNTVTPNATSNEFGTQFREADTETLVMRPLLVPSQGQKRVRSEEHDSDVTLGSDPSADCLSVQSRSIPWPWEEVEQEDETKSPLTVRQRSPTRISPPAKKARKEDRNFSSFLEEMGLNRLAPAFEEAGFATAEELEAFLAYPKTRREQVSEKLLVAKSINLKDWADFNTAVDIALGDSR